MVNHKTRIYIYIDFACINLKKKNTGKLYVMLFKPWDFFREFPPVTTWHSTPAVDMWNCGTIEFSGQFFRAVRSRRLPVAWGDVEVHIPRCFMFRYLYQLPQFVEKQVTLRCVVCKGPILNMWILRLSWSEEIAGSKSSESSRMVRMVILLLKAGIHLW